MNEKGRSYERLFFLTHTTQVIYERESFVYLSYCLTYGSYLQIYLRILLTDQRQRAGEPIAPRDMHEIDASRITAEIERQGMLTGCQPDIIMR